MGKLNKYTKKLITENLSKEPATAYPTLRKTALIADFTFKKFEKVAGLLPFTQREWANILHLSERTLQRYSKENKSFEGIYTDKILHIEKLIKAGLETFSTGDAFYSWLKKEKKVLGHTLDFNSLSSTQGIQDLEEELMRIQHGIYI